MTDSVLEEWINRVIQIVLVCGMYRVNGDPISSAQISVRFDQYDMDEYLKFSDYVNKHYKDYKKVVEINQTAHNEIEMKFTFSGDDVIEFGVTKVKCRNFRIKDWFERQPKDKPINLFPVINQDVNVLLKLSEKDPNLKAAQPIYLHRWFGKSLETS